MNPIIVPLNQQILENFGFTYDGYYWVNSKVPFKLITSNEPGTYMVFIPDIPIGQGPEPLRNNSNLFMLMAQFSDEFIKHKIQSANPASPEELLMCINEGLNKFFNVEVNTDLNVIAVPAPHGSNIVPGNEYTATLMSGIQCKFTVVFGDNSEEVFFCSPNAVSYKYLKELFPDKEVSKLYVQKTETEMELFFGVGIR